MSDYRWNEHCWACGRFVGFDDDCGVFYASGYELDEPDPVWFCKRCAQQSYDGAIQRGYVMDIWYRPPEWAIRASAALREAI